MNRDGVSQCDEVWPTPADLPALGSDEIHVWRVPLKREPVELDDLRQVLSPDEIQRADRYHFERHRHEFIANRGILRKLLARYLNCVPREVLFEYGPQGKPALPSGDIRFNVSNSTGLALIAVTRGRELGVDVEQIREAVPCLEIAERFCTAGEVAMLKQYSGPAQREAFFQCWTRKESFIKATGLGLSCPLDSFEVTLGHETRVTILRQESGTTGDWSMAALHPGEGYVAALTAEGADWTPRHWGWPSSEQR